jgi:hypothetical protein
MINLILINFLYLTIINSCNNNIYKFISNLNRNIIKNIKENKCIIFKIMIYVFYFIKIVINIKKKF